MPTIKETKDASAAVKAAIEAAGDAQALAIFEYGQKHYMLGPMFVFAFATAFSIYIKRDVKPGLIVVAPSGQFKSQVIRTMLNTCPATVVELPHKFTPISIFRMIKKHQNMRFATLVLNDMVMATDGNTKNKNAELMGIIALLLSEDSVSRANFQHVITTKINGRFGFIAACAAEVYRRLHRRVQGSTLAQRVFIFQYVLEKQAVRESTERLDVPGKIGGLVGLPKKPCMFNFSVPRKMLWELSDEYSKTAFREHDDNLRFESLIEGWLCGYAILRGVSAKSPPVFKESDIAVFRAFFPFIRQYSLQEGSTIVSNADIGKSLLEIAKRLK